MTELERIEPIVTAPMLTPEDAKNAAVNLREVIDAVLVPKKHWDMIGKAGKERAVLLKAGAEELQKVFGLSYTLHELSTWTNDEGCFFASVRCSVHNMADRILAESYGLFDSSERNGPHNPNKVVKMAQKRAYVGAIMAATGTSELFTQDLEDDEPAAPRDDPGPASTADQRLVLAELFARKKPCSQREAEEWVREQPHCLRERWVAKQVVTLLLKPDPGAHAATPTGSEDVGGDSSPHGEPPGEAPTESPEPPRGGSGGEPELPPDPSGWADPELGETDDDIPF